MKITETLTGLLEAVTDGGAEVGLVGETHAVFIPPAEQGEAADPGMGEDAGMDEEPVDVPDTMDDVLALADAPTAYDGMAAADYGDVAEPVDLAVDAQRMGEGVSGEDVFGDVIVEASSVVAPPAHDEATMLRAAIRAMMREV